MLVVCVLRLHLRWDDYIMLVAATVEKIMLWCFD